VAATQIITHPTSPQTHLGFRGLRCWVTKTSSSQSSTCIYDRERRSLELLSLMILHWERVNKVLWSVLWDCSIASSTSSSWLVYIFIERALTIVVYNTSLLKLSGVFTIQLSSRKNEASYVLYSQIITYILSLMICIDMILLDNLLQCLIYIIMIDLSSTWLYCCFDMQILRHVHESVWRRYVRSFVSALQMVMRLQWLYTSRLGCGTCLPPCCFQTVRVTLHPGCTFWP
jgi:hypothetical protein